VRLASCISEEAIMSVVKRWTGLSVALAVLAVAAVPGAGAAQFGGLVDQRHGRARGRGRLGQLRLRPRRGRGAPELRLRIDGHTDDVGQPAANQALSEKRAAAVKAWLVARGVDAKRLEAKGFGQTKPAAANDTPEGRQNNRRVELVKM
jgi:OmpA family